MSLLYVTQGVAEYNDRMVIYDMTVVLLIIGLIFYIIHSFINADTRGCPKCASTMGKLKRSLQFTVDLMDKVKMA